MSIKKGYICKVGYVYLLIWGCDVWGGGAGVKRFGGGGEIFLGGRVAVAVPENHLFAHYVGRLWKSFFVLTMVGGGTQIFVHIFPKREGASCQVCKAYLRGGWGSDPPQKKILDFFLKSEGKEVERKKDVTSKLSFGVDICSSLMTKFYHVYSKTAV